MQFNMHCKRYLKMFYTNICKLIMGGIWNLDRLLKCSCCWIIVKGVTSQKITSKGWIIYAFIFAGGKLPILDKIIADMPFYHAIHLVVKDILIFSSLSISVRFWLRFHLTLSDDVIQDGNMLILVRKLALDSIGSWQ